MGEGIDPRLSLTDCTSFVLMKRLKIRKAFAYDFSRKGFALIRPA